MARRGYAGAIKREDSSNVLKAMCTYVQCSLTRKLNQTLDNNRLVFLDAERQNNQIYDKFVYRLRVIFKSIEA